ncbi:MAG: response regulator [Chloroflexota bacterium]|nr:response regulator [Chloroflexota bacterium]MDE2895784.1 response regulator [Chloroflexota bacterium]
MDEQSEHERRIAQPEERLARLSEASLRISESLDFDTVLQQVLDSARDLVGARYGVMATSDGQGGLEAVLTSGTTDEAHQQVASLQGGAEIFSHLIAVPDPIRVDRWDEYAASVGLNGFLPMPVWAGLSAPIRHRGGPLGVICVGHDHEEQKFGSDDEETLVMFAAQATMVITNARRHRQEQQARADLETVIETSPVGVAVLDARTGAPKSFNRETLRIVDRLRDPGQTAAELLEVVICKRADGREISLREFQMTQLLSIGETVRAEEIVLRVDDGRSVTVLLNATPIVSEQGVVESVVVTLQDMAEVEELEHLRAEFLAMVSHELRAPLSTIKGSAMTVLDSAVDLDPAVVRQFVRIIGEQADHLNGLVSDLLDVARIQTGELPVFPEPAEAAVLVDRARTAFANAGGNNPLQIDIEPNLPLVMADRRRVVQVLVNLLNNAGRNSPEGSVVAVSAARDDVHLAISVLDRGRGIPADSLPHLFRKFSRAQPEDQGGDTGLGLAICKGIVEAHGGRIWAESDGPGLGARFIFTLPTVEAAGLGVQEPSPLADERTEPAEAQEVIRVLAVDDDPQALRYIREVLLADGYEVAVTGDPEEALRLMTDELPHLVLLDLVLPDVDGIELMGEMRENEDVPVIFLSAYGRDELIARAFEQGASDYVVKPFSPTELSARIKAALRRREVSVPLPPYVLGDLTVDYATRRVTLAGEPVQLTPTEYRMLAELSANGGQLVTYERLMSRAWRNRSGDDLRPMRTMMGKLRRKLGEDTVQPRYIFTEPRVGFRMPKGEVSGQAEGPAPAADS